MCEFYIDQSGQVDLVDLACLANMAWLPWPVVQCWSEGMARFAQSTHLVCLAQLSGCSWPIWPVLPCFTRLAWHVLPIWPSWMASLASLGRLTKFGPIGTVVWALLARLGRSARFDPVGTDGCARLARLGLFGPVGLARLGGWSFSVVGLARLGDVDNNGVAILKSWGLPWWPIGWRHCHRLLTCLSPLPWFQSRPCHVRRLLVTRGCAAIFTRFSRSPTPLTCTFVLMVCREVCGNIMSWRDCLQCGNERRNQSSYPYCFMIRITFLKCCDLLLQKGREICCNIIFCYKTACRLVLRNIVSIIFLIMLVASWLLHRLKRFWYFWYVDKCVAISSLVTWPRQVCNERRCR